MFILRKLFGIKSKSNDSEKKLEEKQIPEPAELSPILLKAKNQMEFYFSPSNVDTNSFMKQLVNQEPDRYCPISVFMTFNKIIQMNITEDELLEACNASNDLEVDFARRMVRTKVPFKPDQRREYRTVCIYGLDQEENLESLLDLFAKAFGKVLRVEMKNRNRKGGQKYFSGVAYVELESEELANKVAKEGFDYKGKKNDVKLVSDLRNNEKAKGRNDRPKRIPKQGKKPEN